MQASPESTAIGDALLASFRHNFQQYKDLADRALAQISPAEWLRQPAPGSNPAAVIVQHLVGNLRSRFTDFLTTDGEKPCSGRWPTTPRTSGSWCSWPKSCGAKISSALAFRAARAGSSTNA